MIAVEIVCVVLSGIPRADATVIVPAAAVSAANPWCVLRLVSRIPSVRMIRQPPMLVPRAITSAHSPTTYSGIANVGRTPARTSASVRAPMNFWPSLEPWLKAIKAAEAICNQRKTRRTFPGVALRQSQ